MEFGFSLRSFRSKYRAAWSMGKGPSCWRWFRKSRYEANSTKKLFRDPDSKKSWWDFLILWAESTSHFCNALRRLKPITNFAACWSFQQIFINFQALIYGQNQQSWTPQTPRISVGFSQSGMGFTDVVTVQISQYGCSRSSALRDCRWAHDQL